MWPKGVTTTPKKTINQYRRRFFFSLNLKISSIFHLNVSDLSHKLEWIWSPLGEEKSVKLRKLGKLVCVLSVFRDGFILVKLDVDFHYLLTYYYLRYVDISSSTSKFTQTPSIIEMLN